MTTLSDLTEIIRDRAGDHPSRDTLNGAINASVTALTFTDGQFIAGGTSSAVQSFLEIDQETMLVLTKPSLTTATVVRGVKGSTAAAHSNGAEIIANFRHPRMVYQRAINRTLDAISQVFGKPTWDTTQSFNGFNTWIPVPATCIRSPFYVGTQPTSDITIWPVPFTYWSSAPPSLFSTGKAIEITGYNPATGTAYVGYETLWPNMTLPTDTLDSAYPTDAIDLIELGAQAYLLDAEMFERIAFTQPHARVQTNVSQLGEVRMGARDALQEFITRRSELSARYGHRRQAWIKGYR